MAFSCKINYIITIFNYIINNSFISNISLNKRVIIHIFNIF